MHCSLHTRPSCASTNPAWTDSLTSSPWASSTRCTRDFTLIYFLLPGKRVRVPHPTSSFSGIDYAASSLSSIIESISLRGLTLISLTTLGIQQYRVREYLLHTNQRLSTSSMQQTMKAQFVSIISNIYNAYIESSCSAPEVCSETEREC